MDLPGAAFRSPHQHADQDGDEQDEQPHGHRGRLPTTQRSRVPPWRPTAAEPRSRMGDLSSALRAPHQGTDRHDDQQDQHEPHGHGDHLHSPQCPRRAKATEPPVGTTGDESVACHDATTRPRLHPDGQPRSSDLCDKQRTCRCPRGCPTWEDGQGRLACARSRSGADCGRAVADRR